MKKLMNLSVLLLIVLACGCFNTDNSEDPAVKKVQDSLIEVDRDNSVNEADRMLREADSLDKIKQDSIENAKKKK